jgi:quercetin dioxygenase-like cupin family protein
MTIVNRRDVEPKVAHGQGESRSLLQHVSRPGVAPVLHGFQFINRSRLAPGAAHEPHQHDDHEEVFYIVGGEGAILLGAERHPVREGDAIYVPVGTPHGLINDSADWLDFLAIGGRPLTQ